VELKPDATSPPETDTNASDDQKEKSAAATPAAEPVAAEPAAPAPPTAPEENRVGLKGSRPAAGVFKDRTGS